MARKQAGSAYISHQPFMFTPQTTQLIYPLLSHMAEKSLGYPTVSRMGVVQKVQVSVFHCQGRRVSTRYFRESLFRVRESNAFFGERFNDTFLHETPAKGKTWGLRKIRESNAKVTY